MEQFFGITKFKKRRCFNKRILAATRSQFPTINYDPIRASARSGSVTNEDWHTWINDACHYGGSFQDFYMHRDMLSCSVLLINYIFSIVFKFVLVIYYS